MILERKNDTETPARPKRRRLLGGCLLVVLILLLIVILGGYYYTGTQGFAEFVRLRVEKNLEGHLGRDVTIGRVRLVRGYPAKIFIEDLRVANVPNGVAREFAWVRQIEIVGGIRSFLTRTLDLGTIYVRDARINFEIYPEEHAFEHNWPTWKRSKPRRIEITRMELDKLFISGVRFTYNDLRRDMRGDIRDISSVVSAQLRKGIYQGEGSAKQLTFQIQDYEPVVTDMRGSFYYKPGSLTLRSVAMSGRGVEAFVSGKIEPLTQAVYDLGITSRVELERVREVFRVERPLSGTLSLETRLRGRQGEFRLTGDYRIPRVKADVYDLAEVRGTLDVTDEEMKVVVDSGRYGGGSLSADYLLSKYAEPYPMNVDLRYRSVSLEKLFEDWEVKDLGLRGAATGSLEYQWNKDLLLEGRGDGRATLQPGTVAFGNAKYPLPLSGASRFALNRGVVTFAPSTLHTKSSDIDFSGTFAIESLVSDLKLDIRSRDFSELDQMGYNIARSADKDDYELLGLGGSGTITGTVRGPLDVPDVDARVVAQKGQYNNQLLGDGEIDLRYAGKTSVLTFDRAVFHDGGSTISMAGTLTFPDTGPGPVFDLRITADGWSVERAIALVELEILASGLANGAIEVRGTQDSGTVHFDNLRITRDDSQLRLNGDVGWAPGEGNVTFNLDIGADAFPVSEIATFLEFGELPVTGEVTGTLHLEGHKSRLEGAGSVIVRNGSILGEPIDIAMADLLFTEGVMRATHVEVRAPAGILAGEAEVNFADETFSYVIRSSQIDPTKLKTVSGLSGIFTGDVMISSSGAGPFKRPELVLEAFVPEGTLFGRPFPAAEAPTVYLAIRDGQITVQGKAFEIFTIDGSGTITEGSDLSGTVRLEVSDIGAFLRTFAPESEIPAEGNFVVHFQLGGNTSSFERIQIAGTIPEFNLQVAGQAFTIDPPARFGLRNGRAEIEAFTLIRDGASFSLDGGISLTGDQRIDMNVKGAIDGSLLQIFVPDVRARGRIAVEGSLGGTLEAPRIDGFADLVDAQIKIAGFPQLIDDINGRVVFAGDRMEINSFRATVGGGSVIAGGTIYLDGLSVRRMLLTMEGADVALRYFEDVTLDGDFRLVLSGDMDQAVLRGEATIDRAVYTRDFDAAETVLNLLLERRGLVPEVAAPWQSNIALRIKLSAPETLAVKNNVADVTGSAELEVSGTLANPVVLGEVEIDEGGKIRFQDVDYRVTRGTVTFQNPFRIDPVFDITAEGRVQQYELTVNLSGTAERIQTSVTSDPPVSDLTLLSLLGPGSIGQPGPSALSGPASLQRAGTSLLYSSVGGLIGRRILPFTDSFRVDAGLLEGSSSPEPTVTFEETISNDVRVIVVYNTADHTKDRQIVEWQVTPRWVLQFTREGDEDYKVDARFRRRYDGYWGEGEDTELASGTEGLAAGFTPPGPSQAVTGPESRELRQEMRGLPVVEIEFRTDAPADTSHLAGHIPLKAGEPLTITDLQDSISRIYATGNYRDIRVEGTRREGGISLSFILSLNYRVSDIAMNGAGRHRAALRRKVDIRVGDVLSLSRVDRNAEDIRKQLGDLGYLEATVDPETRYFRETNRAEVVYHIDRGPLAMIASIELAGAPQPFSARELIANMRAEPGDVYRRTRTKRDAERVEEFLAKKGRRRAHVDFVRDEYNSETNLVRLVYTAEVGPVVEVKVEGVDQRAVRKWLPFRGEELYSSDAVERGADRIISEFQRRGYYRAAVGTEEDAIDDRWIVTYKIDRGERYTLDDVLFEGNQQLEDEELRKVVTTAKPGGLRKVVASLFRRHLGVTQEELEDDRDVLEAYYRLRGFSEAAVEQAAVRTAPDGTMDVVFVLEEGPQTLVRELIVEGNETFRTPDLPDLQLEVDEPFNKQIMGADVAVLQSFYADRGYVELQVSPLVEVSTDKTSAKVTYRISEGPQVKVDEISVRGNTYTDREVILRSARLETGEPFSYRKILEGQRNLYRLGIFGRVDLIPETADTAVSDRDIVVDVEEGRNLAVAGAVGYATDEGASISGSIAHRNLFGTARYLGLEAQVSQQTTRYFLTYREPFTFNTDIPTQVTIFRTEEENRPGARINVLGTFVEASKVLYETTRWAVRYEYKISTCVEGALCQAAAGQIPIPGLPLEEQDVYISSLTPSWFWDRRDDTFMPHRGYFASASLEYAFPFRRATAEFLKGFTQGSWYLPVSAKSEFVVSGRIGLVEPQGSGADSLVPFSERFVGGGESSHRAFDLDELGIEGETIICISETPEGMPLQVPCVEGGTLVALGGNGLALLNAEYRFPIFSSLRGALFVDAGNVWREIGDIDFDAIRYGVGVGFRYVTPVGPVRLDVGYKLDAEPWEEDFAFTITLGYPF